MTSFLYDLGSPYAWLSAERLDTVLGTDVAWTPVLLGGIFAATGRGSWAETPARADGIAEIEARARRYGLPAPRWPDPWPNNGLTAMRAATHAHRAGRGREFALEAFRVQFTEGRPLSDPSAIERAAARAGLDPAEVLTAAADPEVKAELRAATDAALAAGVTGVPAVLAGGAVFWGDDRLEDAARAAAAA